MIHVRYKGQSWDFEEADLDAHRDMSDEQIRRAVARRLEVDTDRLAGYVVDRPETGHVIVRPEAVYG